MPDQKFTNVLEWKAGSTAAAVQANKTVEASVKSVAAASAGNALRFNSIAEAQKALGLSNAQMGITEAAITTEKTAQLAITERLAAAEKVRASAVEETAIAELRAGAASSGALAGKGTEALAGSLRSARAAAIALPGVGFQSPLPVGLRAAELLVTKTGASLVELGAAAGIAGIAVVAVALAVDNFTKGIEASKKVLTGALSAQDAYYKALAENTSEQTASQLGQLKDQRDLLRAQRDETQAQLDSAFAQAQAAFGDAAARALDAGGKLPTTQLREQVDELNVQFEATDQTITRLRQGLDANVFSTNDAAAAYEELTKKLLDSVQLALRADQLTETERTERIAAARREFDILEELAHVEGTTADAARELHEQQSVLGDEIEALSSVTDSYADILEREAAAKQALTDRNDQYLDAVDREVAAREKAFDIETKIADIAADRDSKLAEQQADYYDRRQDVQTTANEKSLEDTATAEARRQKIIRDAGRSFDEAVGTRDANAYRLANIRASDALADANADANKAVETTAKGQAKQLAALDKGYDKQVQSTRTAAANQLAVQQGLLAEQQFLAQSAAAAQQFIVAGGMKGVEYEFAAGLARIAVNVNSAFNGMSGNRLTGGGSQFATPPTLSSTYPGGPSWIDDRIDTRIAKTFRGGRTITQ